MTVRELASNAIRLEPIQRRGVALAGALLVAVFVTLTWGALSDSAFGQEVSEDEPAAVTEPASTGTEEPTEQASAPPAEEETTPPTTKAPGRQREQADTNDETPRLDEPAEEKTAPVDESRTTRRNRNSDAPTSDTDIGSLMAAATADDTSSAEPVVVAAAADPAPEDSVTAAASPAPAVSQCNPPDYPTGAGQEASCSVKVENFLGADGDTRSRVTTTECLAAAGVLPPAGCTTTVDRSNQLVTSVDQCNGILAGGSNVTCSVEVINNVPEGTPTTGVTVNQCIGSGQGGVSPDGPPTNCDPLDSSTTGATVTQCNGSANGGGAPERVQCSVAGAVTAVPMTVNQCNGSTAAGSTVTCDVTFTNNFIPALPDSTPPDDTPPGGGGNPGDGGGNPGEGGGNPGGTPGNPTDGTPGTPGSPTEGNPGTPGNPTNGTPGTPVALTPAIVLAASSRPVSTELARTAAISPAASSTSSKNSVTGSPATSEGSATGLAATGSATTTMLLVALMAIMLGGLLVLISRRPATRRAV